MMVKRTLEVSLAIIGIVVCGPLLILVALAVALTSRGPVLHWSARVGRHNQIFRMPKFRTMRVDTPQVATHLLDDPNRWFTPIGPLLRRTSIDELPQMWSILVGDIGIVGPRPALFNQSDLIELRTKAGVDTLLPGLTGWAQVNGRDNLSISDKVKLDAEYLERRCFRMDLVIILMTIKKVFRQQGISH